MSRQSSPKSSAELTRKKPGKNDVPFYEPPTTTPTPSQIIKAAREKLHDAKRNQAPFVPESSNLVRTLSSQRPNTPRDGKRSLFGPKSNRPVNDRPPSSFSYALPYVSSKFYFNFSFFKVLAQEVLNLI